jgi:hypothetical protein
VHIQYAHDAYFGLVARLAEGTPADEPAAVVHSAAGPAFRVRLRLAGGPRTRVLTVTGADEADARTRARQQAGAQWAVLDLERIEREA